MKQINNDDDDGTRPCVQFTLHFFVFFFCDILNETLTATSGIREWKE